MAYLIFFTVISALATYELSRLKHIGPIIASTIIGILSYIICLYFNTTESSYILYGASFVGMSSSYVLSRREIIICSLIFLFVFYILSKFLDGHGGLLGMSAFVSVVFLSLFKRRFKVIL